MRVNALVVDLALLGPGGLGVPRARVRRRCPALGVVVCTGRRRVSQRVRGLRVGADDWVTKPCHPEEVLARVEAVVRRRKRASAASDAGPLVAGELEIRADQFQAFVGGRSVDLTRREFELLAAARPGRGQGAPARGDLPGGLGLRDGPRRPLGGRLRPQGAPEARDGLARLALHPHALRRRLPLRARAAPATPTGPRGSRRASASAPLRQYRSRRSRTCRRTLR